MFKKILKPVCFIVIIILTGLLLRYCADHIAGLNLPPKLSSTPFYAAKLPDSNGKMQALSQYKNKIVVINFWATWCPPCKEEMPELIKLQTALQTKNVIVVGIALDEPAPVTEFLKTTPVNYPVFVSEAAGSLLGEQLGNDKAVLPYTVIINADGEIVKTHFGRINKLMLETALLPLFAAKR